MSRAEQKLTLVDKHADRVAIEAQLARRVPLRKLESRYGICKSVLSRHRKRMREKQPKRFEALVARNWSVTPEELERVRTETGEGWIVQLRSQVDKLISAQDAAIEDDRYASGAQLAGQAIQALRMLGEATNNLGDGSARINVTTNNISYSTELFVFRTKVIEALRPFPEARAHLMRVLRGDEGEQAPRSIELEAIPATSEVEPS